jgi:hypothetical protein
VDVVGYILDALRKLGGIGLLGAGAVLGALLQLPAVVPAMQNNIVPVNPVSVGVARLQTSKPASQVVC